MKDNDNLNINQKDLEALLNNASLDEPSVDSSENEDVIEAEFEENNYKEDKQKMQKGATEKVFNSLVAELELESDNSSNNTSDSSSKSDGQLSDFDFSGIGEISFDDISPPDNSKDDIDIVEISQEDLMKELIDVPSTNNNNEDEFNPDTFTTDNEDLDVLQDSAEEVIVKDSLKKEKISEAKKDIENDIIEINIDEEKDESSESMRRNNVDDTNESKDNGNDGDDYNFDEEDNSINKGFSFKSLIMFILIVIAIFFSGKAIFNHFDLSFSNSNNITETEIYSSYEELSQDIEDTLVNLSLYLNNRISFDVLVTNLESTYIAIDESANKNINEYNTEYSQYHQLLINGIKDATKTSDIDNAIDKYVTSINDLSQRIDVDIEKFLKSNNVEYIKTEDGITITQK